MIRHAECPNNSAVGLAPNGPEILRLFVEISERLHTHHALLTTDHSSDLLPISRFNAFEPSRIFWKIFRDAVQVFPLYSVEH